ncbi:protein PIGMENT DEFECTIVE 338, chloroplastic-like isoform X2 [Phragmites australis]|uniref:protein PIGMENT DEFECTIVE 338, chloroplastic-like isoform X2 n=1 Tax=Phragmites australis TaxID=29695 RepID=UPI002D78A1FD|nr:protein PIGMENT DEFECTIVE 338, chloroplastic-like isoform X2 [Phragmites australis]
MPAPATPRGLLSPPSRPQPILPVARAVVPMQTPVQARARAQPVALARSKRLDDTLAAGFVRLLNATPGQGEDASGGGGGERYDPKPGDFVVGVVVSGTEARLDVAVGADRLATLLAKELLPLHRAGAEPAAGAAAPRPGSVGVVASPDVDEEEAVRKQKRGSRALVAPGTVVFAEVLGRTLSGRPLLSARRLFRRLAWHRARQIMQHDEPIEVKIYQWNTGGLLTRIEGLRGFLPKFELMDRISTFADLKNKVGRSIGVCITRLNEETNDLIISEKKAWEMTYLKEGTLLQGTVRKIFPYGAQVRIAGTNRCGLLHISNISRGRVLSACDILKIDDEVKVLVIKSNVPDKIALSIGYLESAPGLFLSDKAVFSEAEEMAKRYREQLPVISQNTKLDDGLPGGTIPFDDEATLYANWKWFKFLQHSKPGDDSNGT